MSNTKTLEYLAKEDATPGTYKLSGIESDIEVRVHGVSKHPAATRVGIIRQNGNADIYPTVTMALKMNEGYEREQFILATDLIRVLEHDTKMSIEQEYTQPPASDVSQMVMSEEDTMSSLIERIRPLTIGAIAHNFMLMEMEDSDILEPSVDSQFTFISGITAMDATNTLVEKPFLAIYYTDNLKDEYTLPEQILVDSASYAQEEGLMFDVDNIKVFKSTDDLVAHVEQTIASEIPDQADVNIEDNNTTEESLEGLTVDDIIAPDELELTTIEQCSLGILEGELTINIGDDTSVDYLWVTTTELSPPDDRVRYLVYPEQRIVLMTDTTQSKDRICKFIITEKGSNLIDRFILNKKKLEAAKDKRTGVALYDLLYDSLELHHSTNTLSALLSVIEEWHKLYPDPKPTLLTKIKRWIKNLFS